MLLLSGLALVASGSDARGPTFWLPEQATELARRQDARWALVYWISVFFFVLITALTILFVIRYRRRPGYQQQPSTSHNTTLEVVWTVIPIILVVIIFWEGYRVFLDMVTPPRGAYEIQVTGQKWNWQFTYPNGYVDADLHVEAGQPVRLVMTSADVIHALFVPDFRIKRDVTPGRYSELWFNAERPGEHPIYCAEYCGTDHSKMLAKVVVHPPGEFDQWLQEASDFLSRMPPAEAGELLYRQRGCPQCHSIDGTPGIAPTFLGLFGSMETLATGEQVLVDENYVRESILNPRERLTAGYDPVMPTYQGRMRDEEIAAIIEYLKTLTK